jgi:hypothetical protein
MTLTQVLVQQAVLMCKCMRCPRMNIAAKTMEQSRRTWAASKCWLLQGFTCALSGVLRTTDWPLCRPSGSSLQHACQLLLCHCLYPRAVDNQPFWMACNEAHPAAADIY